jgi:threonine dehydrogenase-like Zn-dependent dehydrogenase
MLAAVAAVPAAPSFLELRTLERPEPGPGELRLRVTACGLCGSDLHLHQQGLYPPGTVPGHEFAGVVDALGAGVVGLEVGQAVAVEPFRSCGRCPSCRAGHHARCPEAKLLGVHAPGGLAEYAVVPALRAFHVADDLDPRLAALGEPVAVVVHGLRRGGFAPGDRVLVLGAGSLGLLAVLAARVLGASEVWVTARHAHQADLARALGARRVLSEAEASPEALAALGRGAPVDLALETVGGRADTLLAAGSAVRPGGRVAVLGLFLGRVELDPLPLLLKEVTLAWSYCYGHADARADFVEALGLVERERERLAGLLTHAVPLAEVLRAYAIAADKKAGAIKVSVVP